MKTSKTIKQRAAEYMAAALHLDAPSARQPTASDVRDAWDHGYRAGLKRTPDEVLRLRLALYIANRSLVQPERKWTPIERCLGDDEPATHQERIAAKIVDLVTMPKVTEIPGYRVEESGVFPALPDYWRAS